MKKYLVGLAVGFVVIMNQTSYAAPLYDTVYLASGGSLNGQVVDASNYVINVDANDVISGNINIEVYNGHGSSAIVPVAGTVTWGDRATQPWSISGHITPGWHNLSANVDITAPSTPGLYYMIIANAGEFTPADIMSNTSWSNYNDIWNDGNDVGWDWTADQFNQARTDGSVWSNVLRPDGIISYYTGATWVAIQVNSVPVPSAIWILGSGLAGLVGLKRRKK